MRAYSEPRETYAVARTDDGKVLGPFAYRALADSTAKECDGIVVTIQNPLARVDSDGSPVCHRCGKDLGKEDVVECWKCSENSYQDKLVTQLVDMANLHRDGRLGRFGQRLLQQHCTHQQTVMSFVLQLLHLFAHRDGEGIRYTSPKLEFADPDRAYALTNTLQVWAEEVDGRKPCIDYGDPQMVENGPTWDMRNAGSVHVSRLLVSFWHSLPDGLRGLPYI